MLHAQLLWWIGGPILGLCVVAMRWLMNERLGVMGGWSDVVDTLAARRLSFGPFGWMLLGLIAGSSAFALLAGGPDFHGYGWLTDTFSGTGGTLLIAGILFACGILIGLGTKIAGGCTSGNGLSGNAMASPASLVATMTFFATGIAVTVITEALISRPRSRACASSSARRRPRCSPARPSRGRRSSRSAVTSPAA